MFNKCNDVLGATGTASSTKAAISAVTGVVGATLLLLGAAAGARFSNKNKQRKKKQDENERAMMMVMMIQRRVVNVDRRRGNKPSNPYVVPNKLIVDSNSRDHFSHF